MLFKKYLNPRKMLSFGEMLFLGKLPSVVLFIIWNFSQVKVSTDLDDVKLAETTSWALEKIRFGTYTTTKPSSDDN